MESEPNSVNGIEVKMAIIDYAEVASKTAENVVRELR